MSYADIEGQIEEEGFRSDVLSRNTPSVQRVVECVLRNVLTEMDGRDLARCIAMEQRHRVNAYTCSQEQGAVYDSSKHIHANFNRASFCKSLKKTFGEDVRFRQIILDYFWIPQGTWMMTHWTKSFFQNTLPLFVNLLEEPREQTNTGLECGVIYLPFCYHCFREIVSALSTLEQYYEISLILKDKLSHHGLWSGTASISPIVMQETFGKQIDQEEMYCTFTSRDVSESMDDSTVTKSEVVKYLRCIEDFQDVRMIQLKPLPVKQQGTGQQWGGFVNLLKPDEVENGYDQMFGQHASSRVTDSSDDESSEEASVEVPKSSRKSASKRKAPLPIAKRKRVTTTTTTPKEPILYTLVEDLHHYGLLDEDESVANYYRLPDYLHSTMFPDFQRSYWEIANNQHSTKQHLDRTTVDLLNDKSGEKQPKKNGINNQLSQTDANVKQRGLQDAMTADARLQDAAAKLVLFKRNLKLYPCTHSDPPPSVDAATATKDAPVAGEVATEMEEKGTYR